MFKWLIKTCFVVIITLLTMIIIKNNDRAKNIIYDKVYNNYLSFAKIDKLYKKYFGNNKLFENKIGYKPVFNEKLIYSKKEKYKEGYKLTVNDNYLVPSIDGGLVVFIGKKDNYNNTVIVEQFDGVNVLYGNLDNINVKLYDYIDKGSLIGNCNNNLYLVFKKDGKILNYEKKI